MAKHEHAWEHFSHTTEDEAAAAPEPLVVHARLPHDHPSLYDTDHLVKPEFVDTGAGTMLAHDPDNKQHTKMLHDKGVRNFDPAPPRAAGDVYVCECGAARHTAVGQAPEEVDS